MLIPAYITTSNLMQTSFHCPIAILTLNPKGLIEIYICLNSSASGCSEMDWRSSNNICSSDLSSSTALPKCWCCEHKYKYKSTHWIKYISAGRWSDLHACPPKLLNHNADTVHLEVNSCAMEVKPDLIFQPHPPNPSCLETPLPQILAQEQLSYICPGNNFTIFFGIKYLSNWISQVYCL